MGQTLPQKSLDLLKRYGLKFCPGCGEVLHMECFPNNKTKKDQCGSECRICARERRNLDYSVNKVRPTGR